MEQSESYEKLVEALAELKSQLEEANDTIEAIRSGEIDALVVNGKDGHQLFTLKSADQTYRIFIEQMNEGALTLNSANLILYSNSQFSKLIDQPLEKIIGQSFLKFIQPTDVAYSEELIKNAWDNSIKGELKLIKKDGETVSVLLSLKTLDLDEGTSMSIILTDLSQLKKAQQLLEQKNIQLLEAQSIANELNNNLEDTVKQRTQELEFNISEKIKVEEVLRMNEARLTSILQTMGEGLCILDHTGKVTFANPMAQQLFGLDADEILDKTFFTIQEECFSLEGKSLQQHEHPIARLMDNLKSIYDFEILIRNANQDTLSVALNASALMNKKGKLSGVVVTYIDVSNRRKIAAQKDEFISVASHELKTPLTSLKASMQLLSRVIQLDKDSDKIPTLLEKANSNLTKVVHLTEDLMNVSKIQHGPLPLHKEDIKLLDLIVESADHLIKGKGVKLVIEGAIDLQVYADRQRIEQVVVNLFNNAIKYAPESKTIKVEIANADGFAKVSIQDFGQGIAPDKITHLFDRYYQVDPAGKQVSGLGLGLYISHEIIQRHGGTLSVESTVGSGSTFTFTLPNYQITTSN